MKRAASVLSREQNLDEAGRAILGNPEKGCRWCGYVAVKYAGNGRAVLYHPGVECCAAAIDAQIRHRKGELEGLQKQITEKETAVELLEQEADMYDPDSKAVEATKAYARVRAARAQHHKSLVVIRERIRSLTGETGELREKRAALA